MIFEHLNFKPYHRVESKLSSICPWQLFAENGICYLKGDALMCAYEFVAPDLGSSSMSRVNGLSNLFNNAIIQLGENWTVQFELQRRINNKYPASKFENLTAFLVERDREINYLYGNTQYTNRYFLIFTYKLPKMAEMKLSSVFFKKKDGTRTETDEKELIEKEIRYFKSATNKTAGILKTAMEIRMLGTSELATFIHTSVSFKWHKMIVPEAQRSLFIDRIITDETLENSIPLKLGKNYASIISINSFPGATVPAMFDELNKADCELRWSTRFMCYSKQNALKKIKKKGESYHGSVTSLAQMAINSATHTTGGGTENRAALAQEDDALNASVELTMGDEGYGDYCSNIMVWDKDIKKVKSKAEYIQEIVTSTGFSCKEETVNLLQAFLSMQPGNIYANKRELFVSTSNTCHIIPVSSIWAGLEENPFMKSVSGNGAPLVVCGTDFKMPFYLNLHVGQVGHTFIGGQTGAGKSTLLGLLEISWKKELTGKVIIFDKGRSARNLTICSGGLYLEPGFDKTITFQPLRELESPQDLRWASEFIQILLVEQKVEINAAIRASIFNTLKILQTKNPATRDLTSFWQYSDYQDPATGRNIIQDALGPYILGGEYGSLFDARSTNILWGKNWTMIEMGSLMSLSSACVTPALSFLLHQCEKQFDGSPVMLVLDEAHTFFQNEIFAKEIAVWLKTLRKLNVAVVFATQEIEDVLKSPIAHTIVSQCPTKIYLADENAETPLSAEGYRQFGLDDAEIHLLAGKMQKQRDYYYKSSLGCRKFQLLLDELQLAIITTSTTDNALLDKIEEKFGRNTGKELVEEVLQAKNIEYKYLLED